MGETILQQQSQTFCGWTPIVPWGDLDNVCCDDSGLSDAELAELLPRAQQAATELVQGLTGHQFGFYLDRIIPCQRSCGCKSDPCSCCFADRLELPKGPVCGISRYVVGGVDQPTDSINVIWEGDCFFASNCERWPHGQCQHAGFYEACDDEVEPCCGSNFNWWIEYLYGSPVPVLGDLAVEALTCQFVYACSGSSKCELPSGAASVSRQGVSYQIAVDSMQLLGSGLTGIGAVDRFISLVNPNGLRKNAEISIPKSVCDESRYARAVCF